MAECFTPNNAGTGTSIIYSYGSQQSYYGDAQWSTSGYENCPVVFVAVNVNTYVMSQVIPVGYSWASTVVTADSTYSKYSLTAAFRNDTGIITFSVQSVPRGAVTIRSWIAIGFI